MVGSHQILSGAQLNLTSSTSGSTSPELPKPKSWHLASVLPCRHAELPQVPLATNPIYFAASTYAERLPVVLSDSHLPYDASLGQEG